MTRKIIATIVAAALSITSVNVTTAQAGDKELARILFGATALAIIGSVVAAEQRQKAQAQHRPQYQPKPSYQKPHHRPQQHQPHWKKQQRKPVVSRECLMSVRGDRGWTQGYAVRCAQRTTRAALPSDCVRRNYAQGPRLFYAPQCLRRNGFNA